MSRLRIPVLRVLAASLVALASTVAGAEAQVGGAEIRGQVTSVADGTSQPLGFALVEVRAAAAVRTVVADAQGRYRIQGLAPGAAVVRALYLGHRARPVEVVIPAGASMDLDLELTPEPVPIPGLTVTADPFAVPDPDGARPTLSPSPGADVELAILEIGPGLAETALDPSTTGRPEGRDPADPAHVLLMRGSTADLKLVLLDGAPVYTPFHLAGLMDSFDPGLLARAAHHVGGAPARYDGGLSYILDLETRRPGQRDAHFDGAADLLSARMGADLPLGSGGVLAEGRALHNAGPRLLDGAPSPYGYVDGLLKGAYTVRGADLSLTLFGNQEEVRLGNEATPLVPEAARWSNGMVSARLSHRIGHTRVRWTAAASRYDAELPLRTDSAGPANPVLARGETGRQRLALDAESRVGSDLVRFGMDVDRLDLHYASSLLSDEGVVRTDTRSDGSVVGGYGEIQREIAPGLLARLGGRLDHFDPGGTRTALRGSLSWSVTADAVLSLTGGRYHQLTRGTDRTLEGSLVPDQGLPTEAGTERAPPLLAVAIADHMVLGLDQHLARGVDLGLRGFVKRFQNVGGLESELNSSGLDLRLQTVRGERTGWFGYALSWSWQAAQNGGAADQFTGRHLLSAGYQGPVTGPWGVDVRLSFSDGLPFTEVTLDQSRALSEPLGQSTVTEETPGLAAAGNPDSFLRFDVELYGEWDASWMGRQGRIRPYLRILNALDRRDALFYYFEPWRDTDLRPLAERPLLPVLGLAWSF